MSVLNNFAKHYAVLNQWDDGRIIITMVEASSPEEAASLKQKWLNKTSKQRNNRVIAVSEVPVFRYTMTPGGNRYEPLTHLDISRVSAPGIPGVGMTAVFLEEPTPPPIPKVVKLRGTFRSLKAKPDPTPTYWEDDLSYLG